MVVTRSAPAITPALPRPPDNLPPAVRDWANQLVRAVESFITLQTGTPYIRASGLFLPGFPTSEYGLFAGEVFSNHDVLTLVRNDVVHATGLSATARIGSVTTTP